MNVRRAVRDFLRTFDSHSPLVEVGISRQNLLHNLHTYQRTYPHLTFAPVLKSNAYGHGLTLIAGILDRENIAFFMVDSYFEARTLRHAGIRSPIAVIGYVRPEEIVSSTLPNLEYGIVDFVQLRELAQLVQKRNRKPISIHLKLDTGMHRQGILPEDLDEAIRIIKSSRHLKLVGICSHFADAENADTINTESQLQQWQAMSQKLTSEFTSIKHRHLAATTGMAFSEQANTNVGRLGIGLYGFDVSANEPEALGLRPALELRSLITSVREIMPGEFVGYNATYRADKPARIATVPVGYFEGVKRALSDKGWYVVNGKACPIIGRVSMNMSSIDVSEVADAQPGTPVIIYGRDASAKNSVTHAAALAGTNPYEILVHIPQHLKRVVG